MGGCQGVAVGLLGCGWLSGSCSEIARISGPLL